MIMKPSNQVNLRQAQSVAVRAAKSAGALMRRHLHAHKRAHVITQHDIKLELDVRCQRLIEKTLRAPFPDIALLGEEGVAGRADAAYRWVVDPIDGTVNYAYGVPHACVSIALQRRALTPGAAEFPDGYQSLVGVVYDPFCDELWTGIRGHAARLNGRIIRVSRRRKLAEAIVSIGFAKTRENLNATLPSFIDLAHRVRKLRIMGSAALDLAYVAAGRFDAYIEQGLHLWDVAAGGLIVECAGGKFWHQPIPGTRAYRIIASSGFIHRHLRVRF
jgi:myo-inositol-1(or 4)-monophosphatase